MVPWLNNFEVNISLKTFYSLYKNELEMSKTYKGLFTIRDSLKQSTIRSNHKYEVKTGLLFMNRLEPKKLRVVEDVSFATSAVKLHNILHILMRT